ncbi:SGNH/GDSL hydrolase family protein [Cellvibrio mixtus]|uniref:SGNH/GDSL hydrolase family protein n=1 Tax=Cellvibrio mixtus TaxID=39650 RepID=UPI000693F0EC|nr:SGNH/GDSL hydrolase family protein [Cellvibrio mixtus]
MITLMKKTGLLFGFLLSTFCVMVNAVEFTDDSLQYQNSLRDSYREQWIATWATPPTAAGTAFEPPKIFDNQTIRQTVRVSLGGQRFRIRISNAFGTQALKIGAAHLALQSTGAAIVPGSDRTLKFSGLPSISIPAGAVVLSDPIDLSVAAQTVLAVSIYVPVNTGPATYVEGVNQNTYISEPGNHTGATNLPVAETVTSNYFLAVVEVSARKNSGVVIAFGDSVTKGATPTNWPGFLFGRFNANYTTQKLAVVNQGIGCNRILHDFCGPGAAARFDRDVLAITGATHVIVALGLVDIISPTVSGNVSEVVTASDIIVGLKQFIERARAKGLKVYGATITPFGDSIFGVYTPENEATRTAVNRWIRTSGAYDGVIDFDKAVRDPSDPKRFWPIYTIDGIHPNDAGNELMANAIDLALFE